MKHPDIENYGEKNNSVTIVSYVPDGRSQKRFVPKIKIKRVKAPIP